MKISGVNSVPLGLGVGLAENHEALSYFAKMSAANRREVIRQSETCGTQSEMREFVRKLRSWS
jgi:hypothetical protein